MTHPPIGDVCIQLGLMTSEQVAETLAAMTDGVAFGATAVNLGYLDDEGVARSLAQQYRLNLVPGERLSALQIHRSILNLLPFEMVFNHRILPTFLDVERGVLTLLVADPTDVAGLKAAQAAAKAARLRLFVAPRGAMDELILRLYDPLGAPMDDLYTMGSTVVYEPDPARAEAIRRVEILEGSEAKVLETVEAVSAAVEEGRVDRIFYLRRLEGAVSALIGDWRRMQPNLQVCPLDGFGVSTRPAVRYEVARDFLINVVERLVAARPGQVAASRRRQLVRAMADILSADPEVIDAAEILSLLVDGGPDAPDAPTGGRYEQLGRWLAGMEPPWDLGAACVVLGRRMSGQEGPTRDMVIELVYTAATAVAAGVTERADPIATLGSDAARHDGAVLNALSEVLGRVGAAPPPQLPLGATTGRLTDISLAELLQMLTLGGKTALVRVRGRTHEGLVQVRMGRIAAARAEGLTGDEALYALVAEDDGVYDLWFVDLLPNNLAGGSDFLLLEAVRRRDERRSLS